MCIPSYNGIIIESYICYLSKIHTSGCLVMVETTESDHHELVVEIIRRLCRRQLHSHIVACEAMHRPAPGGFLEDTSASCPIYRE